MSVETKVSIELTAEDRASAIVKRVQSKVEALAKSLRRLSTIRVPDLKTTLGPSTSSQHAAGNFAREQQDAMRALNRRFAFESRMSRQQAAESRAAERERRAIEAATLKDFRERTRFAIAMGRQRAAEERQAAREQASAAREAIRLDNYRFGLHERHRRQERQAQDRARRELGRRGRDVWDNGRDAARTTTRTAGTAALVGTATAAAATRRILGAESSIDAAEINTRIYGGLTADAARSLRDTWAAPLAEALGTGTDKLLTAWVDATKLGIPAAGAQAFAELSTKTSEAWSVPFESVTDILGTVNTILTSKGAAFDADRLRSVASTMQHLAAKQSTTPERLISFLQRGAGAAQVLGMSQEAGLAFGSASTSLGNQAAESGRLFDYIASRVIELPRLTRQKGDEGRQARELVRALGYSSANELDSKRRADPDAFLPDFLNRFNRIKGQRQRDSSLRFFAGREWLGELGRMTTGIETYREAQRLAKEAKGFDAIGAVWELHKTKLRFVGQQFKAGWLNILGELGKVLSPMAREAGDVFLAWSSKLRAGGLAARFKAALEGLIEGLGFRDLKGLLEGMFGKPGEGAAGAVESWRAAARGFGQGLREVADTVRAFFGAFTGGDTSPETIARWTARIAALSFALLTLNPLLGALAAVTGLVTSLGMAATAMTTLGAAGGAAGLAGILGATVLPVTLVGIAAGVVAAFWGREAIKGLFLGVPSGDGGKPVTPEGKLGGELGAIAPRGRRQNGGETIGGAEGNDRLGGGPAGDTLHRSSFSPAQDIARNMARMVDAWRLSGARVQPGALSSPGLASLTGGVPGGSSGGSGGSAGGGYGAGLGTSGRAVPGYYRGAGGGSASSNPANSAASAAMLDAIAGTESGKAGYDAVLGNGRYGTPSKPVSTMTLDEAFAFGRQVRARHGSSSALGRYQIVGNTMRAAQKALGLDGSTVFNAETQDRMARWVARNQGLGAWEGLKHNPAAMARAQAAMAAGGAQDAPAGTAGAAGTSGATGGAAGAVDVARRFLGMDENRNNAALRGFMGREVRGAQNAWCAAFVNSSLAAVGLKGTGSGVANSFLGWGRQVDPKDVQKGDVAVEHRGRGLNATGGHVGMATGRTRMRNGRLEVEVIQGNSDNAVQEQWEDASKLAIRRSRDPAAAIRPTPQALATGAAKPASPEGLANQVPTAPARGPGGGPPSLEDGGTGFRPGGGNAPVMHITQHISGIGDRPEVVAQKAQTRIGELWNYRAHDMEPELT